MDSLNPFKSGLNPLNLLGGSNPLGGLGGVGGLEGADPLQSLLSLFGNPAAAGQGQEPSQVVGTGGAAAEGGACNSGCSCCQKTDELGF